MNSADPNPVAERRRRRPPSPDLANHHWAWFLDVDGTLLEIASRPELVTADLRLLSLLDGLNKAYDGAVALISGRSLQQLDAIFGEFNLAAAASHGLEQRLPDGTVVNHARRIPQDIAEGITAFAAEHEGLLVERKTFSISVHYRARPELERRVLDAMEKFHARLDNDSRLMRGKMVVEILAGNQDKGGAIHSFMDMQPFSGRLPVFAGDDVTDEDGFEVVNELGGMSIRIGTRIGNASGSAANWQLMNVADLRTWLQSALDLL